MNPNLSTDPIDGKGFAIEIFDPSMDRADT